MYVLLEPSLIVIALMEIVIPGDPLMLFLLLLYVVFGLLHIYENLLELLILHIFLSLQLLALDIVTDDVFRGCKLFDLEVDNSTPDLHGLGDCWRELETASDQD